MDTNNNKNILWVDDDINKSAMLPDRDEFESRGFNIIPIEKVDDFLKFINEQSQTIDCVIIDISMATGSLDIKETRYGTRTGLILYNRLKASRYKDIKVAMYSVMSSNDISEFCEKNPQILYFGKTIKSSVFANKISELINQQQP